MSIQAGVGLSTDKDHIAAVQEAVVQAKKNIAGDKIDLAFVFSTREYAHTTVLKTISRLSGNAVIIGSSSLAIISRAGICRHGLMVILISLPNEAYFNAASIREISSKSFDAAGKELAEKLLYGSKGTRRDLSLIFCDRLIQDSSGIINGMRQQLGMSFPLIGASPSERLGHKNSHLYFNEEIIKDAACGMLFGGKLTFGVGVKHGWKPLGKPRHITKSRGNIVYEINEEPAAKLYEEYIGKSREELKKELKRISIFYPIGIHLPGEEEYLLRNVISIEDDGSLTLQGDVHVDSRIRLMVGTKESCLEATAQAMDDLKTAMKDHPAEFILVFDSLSRLMLLGRQADREIEIIREKAGSGVPIFGLYTYGEQAPLRSIDYLGKTYFHNQTITILGVGG